LREKQEMAENAIGDWILDIGDWGLEIGDLRFNQQTFSRAAFSTYLVLTGV
jgi:hypothetical protein